MAMREQILIIANCFSIVASVLAYVHELRRSWAEGKRKSVVRYIAVSALFLIVLSILSLGLWRGVHTIEQEGNLRQYPMGIQDIYYPVPFKRTPYLEFVKIVQSDRSSHGPRILKQRPDGFKAELDLDSDMYGWKATGTKSE